jgi:hypothetical protein
VGGIGVGDMRDTRIINKYTQRFGGKQQGRGNLAELAAQRRVILK